MKYRGTIPQIIRDYAKKHEYFSGSISDVAQLLGVSRDTIYEWMKEHPEFSKAMDDVRNAIDDQVENALFKSALGYSYEEKKLVKAGTEEDAHVLQAITVEKHHPANIVAQKFWLENRRSGSWKEKQEVVQSGNITVMFENGDDEFL